MLFESNATCIAQIKSEYININNIYIYISYESFYVHKLQKSSEINIHTRFIHLITWQSCLLSYLNSLIGIYRLKVLSSSWKQISMRLYSFSFVKFLSHKDFLTKGFYEVVCAITEQHMSCTLFLDYDFFPLGFSSKVFNKAYS